MARQTVTRSIARDPRDKNPEATEYYVNATLIMQDVEALQGRPFSAGTSYGQEIETAEKTGSYPILA
jgi:hypothetical protein